ncbi:hypothetical protein F5Y12DRAFT_731499 [Xylaria sp. FL1777]|nr:hypothetical protein F5Y12DRAFT_731499 [Xylaria sp. FL1777]
MHIEMSAMNWEPPPDPDRPECPYVPGFVVPVTEHEPPAPFGQGGYPSSTRRNPSESFVREMPQTLHVLKYPPLDTQWPDENPPPRTAILTITETISVGAHRRAQLAVCQVLVRAKNEPCTAVAKIYDSLYYSPLDCDYMPVYVAHEADKDYSREVLAYRHLQATKDLQKPGFAPDYYGSWTFELMLTQRRKEYKRSIRLVLIEHIRGTSIQNLFTCKHPNSAPNAFQYDESYRLEIIAELLDGVAKQLHSGIDQNDLAPRNVILVPSPKGDITSRHIPRVVLIDYNRAIVYEQTKYGRHEYPNPAERFWTGGLEEFHGWCPIKWDLSDRGMRSYQEWLFKRFGRNKIDFALVVEELKFGY